MNDPTTVRLGRELRELVERERRESGAPNGSAFVRALIRDGLRYRRLLSERERARMAAMSAEAEEAIARERLDEALGEGEQQ